MIPAYTTPDFLLHLSPLQQQRRREQEQALRMQAAQQQAQRLRDALKALRGAA